MFVTNGLNETDTIDLTILVKTNNANSFENQFWCVPIDNGDETVGISNKTS